VKTTNASRVGEHVEIVVTEGFVIESIGTYNLIEIKRQKRRASDASRLTLSAAAIVDVSGSKAGIRLLLSGAGLRRM
jgi:hypothetical protein